MFFLRGRLGVKAAGLALAFATALAGCASTGPMDINGAGGQASPAEKRQSATTLESIDVVGEGDRVMVSATGPVKYTVFRLSDPARLIVDLPGISTEGVPNAIKVNNDFLNDITVESYGGEERIGRLIIGLKDGIEHEVKSGENSLLVMFNKWRPRFLKRRRRWMLTRRQPRPRCPQRPRRSKFRQRPRRQRRLSQRQRQGMLRR